MRKAITVALLLAPLVSCDGAGSSEGGGPPAAGAGSQGRPGAAAAAVPVEVATVVRRDISSYIETNGTLEAENEVDIVARAAGPIVELRVEEGLKVARGELLARMEQDEIRAQLEISRVNLEETRLAYERARTLQADDLISDEEYERARAAFESAEAQYEGNRIKLGYTEIRAPFAGLIVARYVDLAQHVNLNAPLFRLSDFTPLLCPIQVPERDLRKLRAGQTAWLTVEAFPDERFGAKVLRISPVIDASTGTVKVTLEVDGRGRLRPGMFARVFLETEVRRDALVIPKSALSLESIGDTVYVAAGDAAARREVELGFREGDSVEVLRGLDAGEQVVVVGQDGLSDGTPLRVLRRDGRAPEGTAAPAAPAPDSGTKRFDLSNATPEQLDRIRQRMRERGMTEEQIEERLRRARER